MVEAVKLKCIKNLSVNTLGLFAAFCYMAKCRKHFKEENTSTGPFVWVAPFG